MKHRGLVLALAAGHLGLVALGAGSVSLDGLGSVGRALDEYGSITGASSSYAFFAPGVTFQLGARFDVIDAEGRTIPAEIATGVSHEADLRVGNIIDQFGRDDDDIDSDSEDGGLRRALAASLAGKLFSRYPEARAIVVHLESFEPVSMEAFRRGERPAWSPLYEAKFVHQPGPVKELDDETDDG